MVKKLFLKHIKVAAKNGADLVKIQTYEPQDITLKDVAKKFKLKKGIWKKKDLWNISKKLIHHLNGMRMHLN